MQSSNFPTSSRNTGLRRAGKSQDKRKAQISNLLKQEVYLSLGSNLGNKKRYIEKALNLLKKDNLKIVKSSSFYKSEPWGVKEQPEFLNICVKAETILSPPDLWKVCQQVEKKIGRRKREKWGPREIDIDILFYGDLIWEKDNLKIPHEKMAERRFVLAPLKEIAPDFIHPIWKKSIKELLKQCKDEGKVEKEREMIHPPSSRVAELRRTGESFLQRNPNSKILNSK